MKVVNDTSLAAGWLVGRVPPHTVSASCVVKGGYIFIPGGVARAMDAPPQLAGDDPDPHHEQALRYAGDLVPLKPFIDVLLWATGHAPGGKPTSALTVDFSVGAWSKSLVIVGERRRTGGFLASSVSDPLPFTSIPVSYSMAWGGESDPFNPAGRGADRIEDDAGQAFTPLPCVIRPDEIRGNGKSPKGPAGFAPIAPGWDGRMLKAREATFNTEWLKQDWPGYPRDFDWSYFNAAPGDQQLPVGSIAGDEEITLRNLHRDHAELTCRLPGVRPRWFILEVSGGFRELPLTLDTVHVDAEAGSVVLLWRGVTPLRSRRMNEIAAKLIVEEKLSDPRRPAEHYHELLLRRLKEIEAAKHIEPAPKFEIPPVVVEAPEFDVKKFEEELKAEIEAAKKEALAPDPEATAEFDKLMADPFVKEAGLRPAHFANPPAPSSPEDMARSLSESHAALSARYPETAPLLGQPPGADDLAIPSWAKESMAELDKLSRGEFDGEETSGPAQDEDEEWTRERVKAHAAARGSFAGQDLSELDLSGLDLSGLDLSEAMLDGAKLAGAKLAGVNLARATLTECDLGGADLTGAILSEADLSKTRAARVSFRGADLEDATAIEADWTGADLRQVRGKGINLTGSKLAGIDAREADLGAGLLDDADLTGADFGGAKLEATFASGAKARDASFVGADLTNFRGCVGADFSGCRFDEARAASSVWNGSRLDKANFAGVLLDSANFEEASLRETIFSLARMRKAKLADADLSLASLIKADLFRATFEGADLSAADLRGANLFEAEFLDAKVEGAKLELANVRRTKLA